MKEAVCLVCLFFINLNTIAFSKDYSDPDIAIMDMIQSCLTNQNENQFFARFKNQESTDYVGIENGLITIKAAVQLRYQHYYSNKELSLAQELIEEARESIEDFYRKYNLNLQLTFHHAPFDSLSMSPHPMPPKQSYVVYIRKNTGEHMKSVYWGVNFDWPAKPRAMIYTHEFSHKLGLKDEYPSRLSTRQGEPDNIMNNWDAKGARFYPHQIKQIISPLCENKN